MPRSRIVFLLVVLLGTASSCQRDGMVSAGTSKAGTPALTAATRPVETRDIPDEQTPNPVEVTLSLTYREGTWWCTYRVINWSRSVIVVPDHPHSVGAMPITVTKLGQDVYHGWGYRRRSNRNISLDSGDGIIRLIELDGFAPRRVEYKLFAEFEGDHSIVPVRVQTQIDLSGSPWANGP